ncbi:MAG: NAD(P)H-dependent oxidoreductase [Acidimicrobiia bacterium]
MKPKILAFAGSARRSSINKQLARIVAKTADAQGADAAFIDLADFVMPLYHGDLERDEGIPQTAVDLADLIMDADGIAIVSPEYNGAYSPLLKNTIDWVTRVEKGAFARPTALISASPGRMGGKRGLAILRATLENMRVPVVDVHLRLANALDKLTDGRLTDEGSVAQLDLVVASLIEATRARAA